MALLGKEMAVTLPLILLLYDVFWRRHCKWKRYLPFFVVAVLYVALRTAVLGRISGQDAYAGGSIYTAILTAVKASLFYAKLLVFPVKLCIDHKFSPAISFFDPAVMGAIIFVIAAIWVAIFLFGKGRGKKDFSYSGFL